MGKIFEYSKPVSGYKLLGHLLVWHVKKNIHFNLFSDHAVPDDGDVRTAVGVEAEDAEDPPGQQGVGQESIAEDA